VDVGGTRTYEFVPTDIFNENKRESIQELGFRGFKFRMACY
jgi:hypothetical protein